MFIARINTIEEDNEIMSNNRKIAKMLQSVIVKQRNDIDLTNIKAVSGTLKDIESIANPQASKVEITQQTVQSVTEVKIIDA